MQLLDKYALEKLNRLSEYAREQLREAMYIADVSACVSGQGSMFRIHLHLLCRIIIVTCMRVQ